MSKPIDITKPIEYDDYKKLWDTLQSIAYLGYNGGLPRDLEAYKRALDYCQKIAWDAIQEKKHSMLNHQVKFLILKAWFDPMEISASHAFGYSEIGYVDSLNDAEQIASDGGIFPKERCWDFFYRNESPWFRYKEIKKISPTETTKGEL